MLGHNKLSIFVIVLINLFVTEHWDRRRPRLPILVPGRKG